MPNEEGFGIQIEVARLDTGNVTKQIQDQLNKTHSFSITIDKVNTDNIRKSIQKAIEDAYKGISERTIPSPKIPPVTSPKIKDFYPKGYKEKLSRIEAGFRTMGKSALEASDDFKQAQVTYKAFEDAVNSGNIAKATSLQSSLRKQVRSAASDLSIAQNEAKGYEKELGIIGRTKLNNYIENQLQKNTAMTKEARQELTMYQQQVQNAPNMTTAQGKDIRANVESIITQQRAMGRLGNSTIATLQQGISKFTNWIGVSYIVMSSIRSIQNMYKEVVALDTALVDLRKTTTMTTNELEEFYYTSNDTAKQMGITTEEILNQASAWSRLGYSSKEAAQQMAKYSSMFSAISPGMNVDTATDGLVSIMKAFDIGNDNPNDVLDGIMSKVNVIGNTAATSNAEIVNMLSKSSSAMKEANNTLEQTIALETAAVEITRDDDSVGTAFKTVAMRVRGYDEETEEYIGNVEQLAGTIADLTKTASTPGGISLFIDANKTEYKSTYQLLKEISTVYDQLSDKNQAALLEALAGKRQGQIIAATINNFEAAEKAMNSMANSAGSAEAEMAVIMDSIDYKLNALKETGTGIAQNLFQRDEMKAVIDLLTNLAEVLDFVTDKAGLLGTVGLGLGAFLGAKNAGGAKMSAPNNNCFKMPATICVLWDTGVFILSDVKYTLVNK